MAKLYANENFPLEVVQRLRELGHDVLTTHEVGKSNRGIEDDEVLHFAVSEGRCVITINRKDFMACIAINQTTLASLSARRTGIMGRLRRRLMRRFDKLVALSGS